MPISFVSIKCPECGAKLTIEGGRNQAFCTYCGAKILVQNENEHIVRHIDEAKVKKAETDRYIRLKHLEMEEKQQAYERKRIKFRTILSLVLAVIGILIFYFGSKGESLAPMTIAMMILFAAMIIGIGDNNKNKDKDKHT